MQGTLRRFWPVVLAFPRPNGEAVIRERPAIGRPLIVYEEEYSVDTFELPLFPLNTVLYPGMALPLHIFEDRYLRMIEECNAGDGIFGVVRIRSGSEVGGPAVPYDIGVTARITGIQRRPDGKLDLAAEGARRFRIIETVRRRPYLTAQVEYYDDETNLVGLPAVLDEATELARRCLVRVMALNNEWARKAPLPPEPAALSYLVAERLPIDLDEKQELLEAPSAADRLRRETPLLRAELHRLEMMLLHREWMEVGRRN
ncbi:MAG: LON peptidase substrate-binding domain-containing protein [Chloroflexi bacterium]|nr:LON peptidase substrate-binding domain-containing protein [Chloroflexota bacterium]